MILKLPDASHQNSFFNFRWPKLCQNSLLQRVLPDQTLCLKVDYYSHIHCEKHLPGSLPISMNEKRGRSLLLTDKGQTLAIFQWSESASLCSGAKARQDVSVCFVMSLWKSPFYLKLGHVNNCLNIPSTLAGAPRLVLPGRQHVAAWCYGVCLHLSRSWQMWAPKTVMLP